MFNDFLRKNINVSGAYKNQIPAFVEVGYGQVEPNHLSAQRTSQVYAQLPAAANIDILQQGQFVKYDYGCTTGPEVNFTGAGEWMLVFNEIKLYRDFQNDCEFAMIKDNYQARVYSPFGGARNGDVDTVNLYGQGTKQTRFYNGIGPDGKDHYTFGDEYIYEKTTDNTVDATKTYYTFANDEYTAVETPADENIANYYEKVANPDAIKFAYDDVTAGADYYEPHYNEDPFRIEARYKEQMMKDGTAMVPRVFKTNVGDIFTTNTIDETSLAVGDILSPRAADGILVNASTKASALASGETMKWQVVKVYTMPDHQRGAKIMRIA